MKVNDTNTECHVTFSNVSDIHRFLIANIGVETARDASTKDAGNDIGFYGTQTWADFIDIVDNGSDEIISKIKTISHKYSDQLNEKYELSHEYKFDVTGQFFDVGLVMSGEPESWLSPLEDEVKKQIEINVNASYLSDVSHDDVINNASRIVGMVLSLEKMGVETKINLNFRSDGMYLSNKKKIFMVSLVAKEYEQGIDYKKLSALLHTAMFRRGIFRVREVLVGKDWNSYGSTKALDTDTKIDKRNSVDELEHKLFRSTK